MHDGSDYRGPTLREIGRGALTVVGILAYLLLMSFVCLCVPFLVSVLLGEWIGMVAALAAFLFWGKFGPPPSPGIVSGALCVTGYGLILVLFLWNLVIAVASLASR